jgi:putative sugar O-methyltransferase
VFGELGSGYGRLGYIFGLLTNARYCFFDIPPALGIAQVYFETIFSDKKIFGFRDFSEFDEIRDELSECQFAFFTANQIKQFPDRYFDTFINISSLQEMALPQIKNYLSQMDRLTNKAIYLKQYVRHENDQDGIVVTSNDYDLPNHWQVTLDQPDAVIPAFFERLLLRL